MRRPIIAANWKMHKTTAEACDFLDEFLPAVERQAVEIVICPPFTSIEAVAERTRGTGIAVGAQNVFWETRGAFTGEVSAEMLASAGCTYCIVGHSERRMIFGESDRDVGLKVSAVLAAGLNPIICIGETIEERQKGNTVEVVTRQLTAAIAGVSPDKAPRLVIAYEPVWAIGTGTPATPEDALEVAHKVREVLDEVLGKGSGEVARIQYGGSVKPENIADFMRSDDIDGALVGGASLQARGFAALINNSLSRRGAR